MFREAQLLVIILHNSYYLYTYYSNKKCGWTAPHNRINVFIKQNTKKNNAKL